MDVSLPIGGKVSWPEFRPSIAVEATSRKAREVAHPQIDSVDVQRDILVILPSLMWPTRRSLGQVSLHCCQAFESSNPHCCVTTSNFLKANRALINFGITGKSL